MFSAASESAGSASGTSTTSSWPRRTLYAGSTAAPSTRMCPSFASRAMALRERRLRAARKRSTRCPPSSTRSAIRSPTKPLNRLRRCGAVLLVPERRGDEDDPDHDRGVGDAEGPEADLADADVDEIDDVSLGDAVEQIAERAAELHAERRGDERRAARDLPVVIDDREHRDDGKPGEGRGALRQQPEGGTGVLGVNDPDVLADNRARGAERNVLADPG